MSAEPVFATQKIYFESLADKLRVVNFQLRDHLLVRKDVYLAQCRCRVHREVMGTVKPVLCGLVVGNPVCDDCSTLHRLIVEARSFMHHLEDIANSNRCLRRSPVPHIHRGPCHYCLGCRTRGSCEHPEEFSCYVTYDIVASSDDGKIVDTVKIEGTEGLKAHVFDQKAALNLYVCHRHQHTHRGPFSFGPILDDRLPPWPCSLANDRCCDDATSISKLDTGFALTHMLPKKLVAATTAIAATNAASSVMTARAMAAASTVPATIGQKTTTTTLNSRFSTDGRDGGFSRNLPRKRKHMTLNGKKCEVIDATTIQNASRLLANDSSASKRARTHLCDDWSVATALACPSDVNSFYVKDFVVVPMILNHEQSITYLLSLVKSVMLLHSKDTVIKRYNRYISGGFLIPNVLKFKSGKDSVMRNDVTGFSVTGLYQTALLSEKVPVDEVLIPARLYDELSRTQCMEFVIVKRDPAITSRTAFVVRPRRNDDLDILVVIISACLASLLNQDQDGDKNGVYLLPLTLHNGWSIRHTLTHSWCLIELARAFRERQTLTGLPRHSFSEHDRTFMYRNRDRLTREDPEFFGKYYDRYGPMGMSELGCAYKRDEYERFRALLTRLVAERRVRIGVLDILRTESGLLHDEACASSSRNMLMLRKFDENLRKKRKLKDCTRDWMTMLNLYIESEKTLKRQGSNMFTDLFQAEDLVVVNDKLMHNKTLLSDMRDYANYIYRWPEPVLREFANTIGLLPNSFSESYVM